MDPANDQAAPESSTNPGAESSSGGGSPPSLVPSVANPTNTRPPSSDSNGTSPPSSPPVTPNTDRRGVFHIPVCLDNSKFLAHSNVAIRSNQSEDDIMTFQHLRGEYSKLKEFIQHLIFKPLVRIHRVKVPTLFWLSLTLSFEFIKIVSRRIQGYISKNSVIIKNSFLRRLA
jgi:hypothetical protein